MIFWGTRGSALEGEYMPNLTCESCGGKGMYSFGIRRHFHLYWIPTFITSKQVGIQCNHCKKALMDDEIEPTMLHGLKEKIFNKKATLPYYSGLFLIAIFGVAMLIQSIKSDFDMRHYAESPATGDVYRLDARALSQHFGMEFEEEYRFTAFKVTWADEAGNVDVIEANYIYESMAGLAKGLREGEAFEAANNSDTYRFKNTEVALLLEKNIIFKIDRT